MKKITNWIITTIIGALLGILTERMVFGRQVQERVLTLKAELNATRGQLREVERQLGEKSAETTSLQAKIRLAQDDAQRINVLQTNFQSAQSEILSLQSRLATAESDLSAAQAQLADIQVVHERLTRHAATGSLQRIEGIGPKSEQTLLTANVTTFAQIADMSSDELTKLFKEAGIRRPNSIDTWAEQAALAAAGEWEALDTLQAELVGGRRVG